MVSVTFAAKTLDKEEAFKVTDTFSVCSPGVQPTCFELKKDKKNYKQIHRGGPAPATTKLSYDEALKVFSRIDTSKVSPAPQSNCPDILEVTWKYMGKTFYGMVCLSKLGKDEADAWRSLLKSPGKPVL